jgi:hypothetical protein
MKMDDLNHTEKQNKMRHSPREHIDKMIEEVLTEFDFNRVFLTMRALNWTWGMQPSIPSIDELKRSSERLLRGAVKGAISSEKLSEGEAYIHATGGLKASAYRNRYKAITSVHLEFVVTSWESDGD